MGEGSLVYRTYACPRIYLHTGITVHQTIQSTFFVFFLFWGGGRYVTAVTNIVVCLAFIECPLVLCKLGRLASRIIMNLTFVWTEWPPKQTASLELATANRPQNSVAGAIMGCPDLADLGAANNGAGKQTPFAQAMADR